MSKQEEIKKALAAMKTSTDIWLVWDQQDGLVCVGEEREKAFIEYEEQLEAVKDDVSANGSMGEENVILARIEKQAWVTLNPIDDHSELIADWNEYERDEFESMEVERLHKELEEERKKAEAIRRAMQDVLYYLQRDSYIPAQDILEQYLALGQEGEGNQ